MVHAQDTATAHAAMMCAIWFVCLASPAVAQVALVSSFVHEAAMGEIGRFLVVERVSSRVGVVDL